MHVLHYLRSVYVANRLSLSKDAVRQIEIALRWLDVQGNRTFCVGELCESSVISHLKWLESGGRAPSTINRRRGHLLTIWKDAYRTGHNTHDYWRACVPKARTPKKMPVAWSLADIELMLSEAERVKVLKTHPFDSRHWRALILLLYYTGLRIKSALSLRRSDVKGHLLLVPDAVQKDDEELAFRLPGDVVNLLVALPRPNMNRHGRQLSEYLIPWPWRLDYAQKAFTRYILRPAGLPTDRRHKFHAMRRTVATLVAATRGKEAAKEIMGHSSIKTTELYLADPSTVDPSLPSHLSPLDVLPKVG